MTLLVRTARSNKLPRIIKVNGHIIKFNRDPESGLVVGEVKNNADVIKLIKTGCYRKYKEGIKEELEEEQEAARQKQLEAEKAANAAANLAKQQQDSDLESDGSAESALNDLTEEELADEIAALEAEAKAKKDAELDAKLYTDTPLLDEEGHEITGEKLKDDPAAADMAAHQQNVDGSIDGIDLTDDEIRSALADTYTELYGKKPTKNMSIETLNKRIQEMREQKSDDQSE